jgi:hypothetical protein
MPPPGTPRRREAQPMPSLRKRLMALDPATVSTVLSSCRPSSNRPTRPSRSSRKARRRTRKARNPARPTRDPAARIAELETTAMQQAEAVKLLAEQHAITIEALRREAARLTGACA